MMVERNASLLAVGRQEVNGLTLELFAPSVMPSRELFSTNLQYQTIKQLEELVYTSTT